MEIYPKSCIISLTQLKASHHQKLEPTQLCKWDTDLDTLIISHVWGDILGAKFTSFYFVKKKQKIYLDLFCWYSLIFSSGLSLDLAAAVHSNHHIYESCSCFATNQPKWIINWTKNILVKWQKTHLFYPLYQNLLLYALWSNLDLKFCR